MGDLRLGEWIGIAVGLALTFASVIAIMFLIVLWPRLVSSVSRLNARARAEGEARRAYRRRMYDMSTQKRSHIYAPFDSSQRSYAVEPTLEPSGTEGGNRVPALVELLGTLSDDEWLDILARVSDASGKPKFADSRIAKFVGGRVEDRIAQVRDVRGNDAPLPPKPQPRLRVRDNGVERLIAKYGSD